MGSGTYLNILNLLERLHISESEEPRAVDGFIVVDQSIESVVQKSIYKAIFHRVDLSEVFAHGSMDVPNSGPGCSVERIFVSKGVTAFDCDCCWQHDCFYNEAFI
eukprot:TRINITY_DN6300_c0_g1_i1.p4 TRINITY_DN6300_c0_g1~~TRINITY_DN6300_c0_g1_i1.p4  ORF type:complete len:105 (-),score=6.79 TRINITY_DN6300_c0_g1_i1:96-410(-)